MSTSATIQTFMADYTMHSSCNWCNFLFRFFVSIFASQVELINMDTFEIPVTFKNNELCFKAHVVRFGFVNHIIVDLFGNQVTIERDEEGTYRALGDVEKFKDSKVDVDLIKEIITVLESL